MYLILQETSTTIVDFFKIKKIYTPLIQNNYPLKILNSFEQFCYQYLYTQSDPSLYLVDLEKSCHHSMNLFFIIKFK